MSCVWITADGKDIKVEDMSTKHIINTINCIESGRIVFLHNLGWLEDNDCQIIEENDIKKERWLNIFNDELKRRGYSN